MTSNNWSDNICRSFVMNNSIKILSRAETESLLSSLCKLLIDCVASGASIGFLPPLSPTLAENYWKSVAEDLDSGERVLLVAQKDTEILGAVQFELAMKENAKHRAEIQKLMVHTKHRGKGIARILMTRTEEIAFGLGRTLLVLDTKQGDAAETLYEKWDYQRVGVIPQYAKSADGRLHGTVFFYKSL